MVQLNLFFLIQVDEAGRRWRWSRVEYSVDKRECRERVCVSREREGSRVKRGKG
jgi:hypothetical protein